LVQASFLEIVGLLLDVRTMNATAASGFTALGGRVPFLVSGCWQESLQMGQFLESDARAFVDTGNMSPTTSSGPLEPENGDTAEAGRLCSESARPVTAEQLAELEFFRGISVEHLRQIARYSKRCHFEAGETLFRQGDVANCFFVVSSGRVLIEFSGGGGGPVPVQEIGPGEPVGFSWFFNPDNVHFTSRALDRVEAVFFYGTLLREDCEIDHELGYELMRRTSQVMLKRLEALAALLSKALTQKPTAPAR
jgi:CRP/FNR family transcriptional regulator, cyclic AMP receptor protein